MLAPVVHCNTRPLNNYTQKSSRAAEWEARAQWSLTPSLHIVLKQATDRRSCDRLVCASPRLFAWLFKTKADVICGKNSFLVTEYLDGDPQALSVKGICQLRTL